MKSAVLRFVSRLLIASMLAMSFQAATAGMIGTDQAISASTTTQQTQRTALINTLSRDDVASQLQAQGVDPLAARERIASMTDQEVAALADRVDALPAGGMSSGGWWAVAIVVALVVWYLYAYK